VPVSASWRDIVDGDDRKRALRALEASALTGLRKGLCCGSVWINHSLSFRERDQLLIPPARWESERDRHLLSLGLPPTADPFLERLTSHLQVGFAALDEAREAGRVTIGPDGALHLSALEALPTDGVPKRTRDLMYKAIGNAQFADMVMQMDARTGFGEMLLARKARDSGVSPTDKCLLLCLSRSSPQCCCPAAPMMRLTVSSPQCCGHDPPKYPSTP